MIHCKNVKGDYPVILGDGYLSEIPLHSESESKNAYFPSEKIVMSVTLSDVTRHYTYNATVINLIHQRLSLIFEM